MGGADRIRPNPRWERLLLTCTSSIQWSVWHVFGASLWQSPTHVAPSAMALYALPTAGIWTQLHVRAGDAPDAGVHTRPVPAAVVQPLSSGAGRLHEHDGRLHAARRQLDLTAAEAARAALVTRAEQQLAHRLLLASPPPARAPPMPSSVPRAPIELELAASIPAARESTFLHAPMGARAPIGSGHSPIFFDPPSKLSQRDRLILEACDWSPRRPAVTSLALHRPIAHTRPTSAIPPVARDDWPIDDGVGLASSLSDRFTSGSDGHLSSSHTDSDPPPARTTMFDSRNRDRMHAEPTRTRRPKHTTSEAVATSLSRNTPLRPAPNPFLQSPAGVFVSPLTARTDMSSLLGLTPMTAANVSHARYTVTAPSDSYASLAFSDADQTWASARSPPSHRGPTPTLSASKAQHLAEAARVRMQLRAEHAAHHPLSAIPSSESGSSALSSRSTSSTSAALSDLRSSSLADDDSFTPSFDRLTRSRGVDFHPRAHHHAVPFSSSDDREGSGYVTSSLLAVTNLSDS